jgi:hypothetical protein
LRFLSILYLILLLLSSTDLRVNDRTKLSEFGQRLPLDEFDKIEISPQNEEFTFKWKYFLLCAVVLCLYKNQANLIFDIIYLINSSIHLLAMSLWQC